MSDKKTILYVGGLFKGSTGLERKNAFEQLGYEIILFDTDPYVRYRSRIELSLTHRLAWGPAIRELNYDLVSFCRDKEYDFVWFSKGIWIWPATVETLKKNGKAISIHFTPDAAILFNRTRHFIKSIPVYDFLITSKPWEVHKYKRYGAKNIFCTPQGTNLELLKPYSVTPQEKEKFQSDVCFIGRFEPHYYRHIKAAHELKVSLAVWGHWQRHFVFHPWLRDVVRGEGVWHQSYAKAIVCTKIGLGLLSKLIPETATTRTFEIPACGTFMLAERTDEHLSYFEEGKEAEFFDSVEEMQDKIRYYLKHEDTRETIARAGRERCLRSGYDNKAIMRRCLEAVLEANSG